MKFDLVPIPKAKNLDCAGFTDGYVLVRFRGRPTQYLLGPKIPRETFDKLFTAMYPDRQFQLTIKNKFQCKKLG